MNDKKYTTVQEAIHNREIGLSEVRTKLTHAIEKLKSLKNFQEIAEKQLKDFWPEGSPPAPFEELFTLKQISTINIDTFFKKRSLGPSKILGIVGSIENATSGGITAANTRTTGTTKQRSKAKATKSGKLKLLQLQYNMLENKCRLLGELIELGYEKPKAMNSKTLDKLPSEIEKIDKILTSHNTKIAKLIQK